MSRQHRHALHYSRFADEIDIDAFEEAIGFEPLDHRKGEDIGYCPDLWGMHKHGDTTGKFSINREKRVYHCWVCGGGSLLSLAMEFLSQDEEAATEWLKQFTRRDARSDSSFIDEIHEVLDRHMAYKAERMPYFNAHVLSQFHNEGGEENELYEWCESRGINDEIAVEHQLGYSHWHKKAAPLRGGEKIDDDYFGPCIVFPHFWKNRLVGWQHRWLNYGLDTPKWLPKYTNTSDFPKSTTVYNHARAFKQSDYGPVVVVESVPTCLFLESMGINAVATFGSGAIQSQLELLVDFTHGVVIAPDNDAPGEKFVAEAVPYLERETAVKVLPPVTLKPGADLGDYIDVDDPVGAVFEHLEQGKFPWSSAE